MRPRDSSYEWQSDACDSDNMADVVRLSLFTYHSPERLTVLIAKVASGICLLQSDCFSINYPVHFAVADTHIIIKASLNHYKFHLAAYYMMAVCVCESTRVFFRQVNGV